MNTNDNLTKENTFTVVDNRTGKTFTIPINTDNCMHFCFSFVFSLASYTCSAGTSFINASEFQKFKLDGDTGPRVLDQGYMRTACCESEICQIDGSLGTLKYRGYNIEELVEKSSFLEVAYLLIYGELPDQSTLETWTSKILGHTYLHQNLVDHMKNFRYDAHPMGQLVSSIAAMSTFYPEANTNLTRPDLVFIFLFIFIFILLIIV